MGLSFLPWAGPEIKRAENKISIARGVMSPSFLRMIHIHSIRTDVARSR
jgi:hypothetical protein